jgi:hypothetical protein
MTTPAQRALVRRAKKRSPAAAAKLEHALKNAAIDAILKRNTTRRVMVRDDGVDHVWPNVPMLTRPLKSARRR